MSFQFGMSPFGRRVTGRPYYDEVMADSPLAYWRLGEASGTTAADAVGSHAGTYVGSPTLGVAGAIAGNAAVTFNGLSQYVSVTYAELGARIGAGISVEMWVKKSTSVTASLCGVINDGLATAFLINDNQDVTGAAYSAGKLRVYTRDNSNSSRSHTFDGTTLNNGAWHHFAATLTSTTFKVFIDGTEKPIVETLLIGSGNPNPSNFQYPILFGARSFRGVPLLYTAGTIDEVAIYPTALSPARIAAHYAARNR